MSNEFEFEGPQEDVYEEMAEENNQEADALDLSPEEVRREAIKSGEETLTESDFAEVNSSTLWPEYNALITSFKSAFEGEMLQGMLKKLVIAKSKFAIALPGKPRAASSTYAGVRIPELRKYNQFKANFLNALTDFADNSDAAQEYFGYLNDLGYRAGLEVEMPKTVDGKKTTVQEETSLPQVSLGVTNDRAVKAWIRQEFSAEQEG